MVVMRVGHQSGRWIRLLGACAAVLIVAVAIPTGKAAAKPAIAKAKVVLVSSSWSPELGTADVSAVVQTRVACRANRKLRLVGEDGTIRARSDANGDVVFSGAPVPAADAEYEVKVKRKRVRSGGIVRCRSDRAGLSYRWVESGVSLSYDAVLNEFIAHVGGQDPTCVNYSEFPMGLYRNSESLVGSALVLIGGSWNFPVGPNPPAAGSYDVYVPAFSAAGAEHLGNGGMIAAACAAIDSNEVVIE